MGIGVDMLLWIALTYFAGDLATQHLRVDALEVVDGFSVSSDIPIAMLSHQDQIYVLDGDARLLRMGLRGRSSSGDASLEMGSVRGLFPLDDKVLVIDQNGYRRVTYSRDGKLLGTAITREPALYQDQDHHVIAINPRGITDQAALRLNWTHHQKGTQIDLLLPQQDDSISPDALLAQRQDNTLLVVNGVGRKGICYYTLLQLDQATHQEGMIVLTASPSANQVQALLAGLASSSAQGFVLTEAKSQAHTRILHVLAKNQDVSRSLTIHLEPTQNFSFFQPLSEGAWLAFDGTRLVRFHLIEL